MGESLKARAPPALCLQYSGSSMQITTTLLELGGRAAYDGHESLEEVGDGVAALRGSRCPWPRVWALDCHCSRLCLI